MLTACGCAAVSSVPQHRLRAPGRVPVQRVWALPLRALRVHRQQRPCGQLPSPGRAHGRGSSPEGSAGGSRRCARQAGGAAGPCQVRFIFRLHMCTLWHCLCCELAQEACKKADASASGLTLQRYFTPQSCRQTSKAHLQLCSDVHVQHLTTRPSPRGHKSRCK